MLLDYKTDKVQEGVMHSDKEIDQEMQKPLRYSAQSLYKQAIEAIGKSTLKRWFFIPLTEKELCILGGKKLKLTPTTLG